jgi:hypothetical protein
MNLSTQKRPFNLSDYLKYSTTFIETGSCRGDGIEKALDAGFEMVLSVELHDGLFEHCSRRFSSDQRVTLFKGYSYDCLPKMLKERSVIFLDAHPAGPNTAGHEELMNEGTGSAFDQDIIIKKELAAILSHRKDHCIIIDDCQGENHLTLHYKSLMPGYKFRFYDQDGHKDKILVCEPTLTYEP